MPTDELHYDTKFMTRHEAVEYCNDLREKKGNRAEIRDGDDWLFPYEVWSDHELDDDKR